MAVVEEFADKGSLPFPGDILWDFIGQNLKGGSCVPFVAPTVQGLDDEVELAGGVAHPVHPVGGGLVMELDGFPVARSVGGGLEIENSAAVDGIVWAPLCADGDLSLAVAIKVTGGNAYVVALGKVSADLVFFPGGILVPGNLVLVDEDDVDLLVAVHVSDLEAVADADLGVDVLLAELGFSCGEAGGSRDEGK